MTRRQMWRIYILSTAAVLGLSAISAYVITVVLDPTKVKCVQTLKDAQSEDNLGNNWIPAFVPSDAFDLCWESNAETGTLVLSYRFQKTALDGSAVKSIEIPREVDIPRLTDANFDYSNITGAYAVSSYTVLVSDTNRSVFLWD